MTGTRAQTMGVTASSGRRHDLARLMHQFHFFRRVALVVEAADLRDDVAGDLARKGRAGAGDGASPESATYCAFNSSTAAPPAPDTA